MRSGDKERNQAAIGKTDQVGRFGKQHDYIADIFLEVPWQAACNFTVTSPVYHLQHVRRCDWTLFMPNEGRIAEKLPRIRIAARRESNSSTYISATAILSHPVWFHRS